MCTPTTKRTCTSLSWGRGIWVKLGIAGHVSANGVLVNQIINTMLSWALVMKSSFLSNQNSWKRLREFLPFLLAAKVIAYLPIGGLSREHLSNEITTYLSLYKIPEQEIFPLIIMLTTTSTTTTTTKGKIQNVSGNFEISLRAPIRN